MMILILISFFINFEMNYIIENKIIKNYIIKNTKVCICTPVKKENRYIKEYVEHLLNMELIKYSYMTIIS